MAPSSPERDWMHCTKLINCLLSEGNACCPMSRIQAAWSSAVVPSFNCATAFDIVTCESASRSQTGRAIHNHADLKALFEAYRVDSVVSAFVDLYYSDGKVAFMMCDLIWT